MEEKEKNKYILIIIILCFLVGLLSGLFIFKYFISKQDNNINNNSNINSEINDEKTIYTNDNLDYVTGEVNRIFNHFSPDAYDDEEDFGCGNFSAYKYDFKSNKNFFENYGAMIMKYVYGMSYVRLQELMGASFVMSPSDYKIFQEYFSDVTLNDYTVNESSENIYLNKNKPYSDEKYKLAYIVGDGCGYEGDIYSVEKVYKDGNYYYADIIAGENYDVSNTQKNYSYKGTLKMEIINNHLKFYPLTFTTK